MRIILEPSDGEPEVVIRGRADDPLVQKLLGACRQVEGASRLFLYRDDRAFVYDYSEVDWFEAGGGGVTAHIGSETLEARCRLYELAEAAAPHGFVQISKGLIVNIARVRSVTAEFSGNYLAELKDGKTRLVISRKYVKSFRKYVMEVL
ncbi:MAG: LytTR family transcriptional regulator [Lachnospiraceae bacterium]|nr:LytTR family transcriptional regulator [Lachnospiraceae bacterium]